MFNKTYSSPNDPRSRQLLLLAGGAIAIWSLTIVWLWASLRSHLP